MRRTHSEELRNLINFLNVFEDPSKRGRSAQASKFMRDHGGPLADLVKARNDIAHFLRCLQPEIFNDSPPKRVDPKLVTPILDDISKKVEAQKAAMVRDFPANQASFLEALLKLINEAESRATWVLSQAANTFPFLPIASVAIDLAESRWILEKYPAGGRGTVFHWFARVLEQGELSKLRCCRVCKRQFFVPTYPQQKSCNEQCQVRYNKKWARLSKATLRNLEKKRRQKALANKHKSDLLIYLQSSDFNKRLSGVPRERAEKQKREIELLQKAVSVQQYLRTCDPAIRRIIELHGPETRL